jgi:glycosyltransferase involved in cell wall biosynthesis
VRILFISCGLPYPLEGGGQNLIYHWLKAANNSHDADLLVIGDPNIREQSIPGLPKLEVHVCPLQASRRLRDRVLRQTKSLSRSIPATSLVVMSRAVQRQIRSLFSSKQHDVIVLTENGLAGFTSLLSCTVPVLLLKHSIHAVDAADERRRNPRRRLRWLLEERIVKRFEARTCRSATLVCCVNQEDADYLSSRYKLTTPAAVVPLGVDPRQFPSRTGDPATKVIGFIGNLSWGANADAARWFCRHVLPLLWRTHPDATFLVIGPGGEGLRFLSEDSRIRFVGRVPSVHEAVREVSVGVVPVISGTGMRCKLLDMLSMGIPTVSTSLGARGIRCVRGQHLLIADGAKAFAKALETLLSDASLRKELSVAGSDVARAYSWVSIYPKIWDALDLAVRRFHQGPIDESRSQVAPYSCTHEAPHGGF